MSNDLRDNTSPVAVSVDELLDYRYLAKALNQSKKRVVSAERSGEMQSRALGRGLDFSELREYQAGDDIRQIDWNVTARTGKPHTKLFRLEKERPCFVVVDLRLGMSFATRCAFKSVIASRLAALLAWSAVIANDRVGGLVFSDSGHFEVKPETGRRGLIRLFKAIADRFDGPTAEHANPDALPDAIARLSRLAHTGSTIWMCSDFQGLDARCRSRFSSLMKHNVVNAIQIADVMEANLPPPGDYLLRSEKGELRVDTRTKQSRSAYHAQFNDYQKQLRQLFNVGRHTFRCVYTDDDLVDKASEVLRRIPEKIDEEVA